MDDVLQTLGFVRKAGKIILGEEVLKQASKIKLMFIASDISEKSRERLEKKCFYYQIKHVDSYTGKQLSDAIGRNNVKVLGIADRNFADMLNKKL